MGQMYTLAEDTTGALGDVGDLLQLVPVSDNPILIHSIRLGQNTLEADAQAEMAFVRVYSATVPGTGGSATPAVVPLLPGQETADAAVLWNNTVDASGTELDIIKDSWNVQAGWLYLPTPEERPWFTNGAAFVIENAQIVATCTITLTVVFEEFKMV